MLYFVDSSNKTLAPVLIELFGKKFKTITIDWILLELPDTNRLDMKIYSSNRHIDFDKFSEETKETVSLASRLVKETAERHQIIFLTCREEYAYLLVGNLKHI